MAFGVVIFAPRRSCSQQRKLAARIDALDALGMADSACGHGDGRPREAMSALVSLDAVYWRPKFWLFRSRARVEQRRTGTLDGYLAKVQVARYRGRDYSRSGHEAAAHSS